MKAITVKQPWASMIAQGVKTIETRTWNTRHRGPLLICAASRPQVDDNPVRVALCVVDVVDCRPMTDADAAAACVDPYPRAKAWVLANVRQVRQFKVAGRQLLFDVPDELIHIDRRGIAIPACLPKP